MKTTIYFLCSIFIFSCCNNDSTLFTQLTSAESGITFQNNVIENETFNLYDFHNMYNGAGVAIGDINNDSLPDIYFASNMGEDKLYLNKGDFRFEDISAKSLPHFNVIK